MDEPDGAAAAAGGSLRLLGRPAVHWHGGVTELHDGLPQRLLALLAARRDWVARDELAAVLWPTFDGERQRANLRRVLGRARELPYAATVEADRDRLRWRVPTDLDEARDGARPTEARLAWLTGDLLAGFALDEDEPFGAWLVAERRKLEALRRELLLRRAQELEAAGDPRAAMALASEALALDPLDEEAVQRYLVAAATAGAATEARHAYRRFAATLEAELGLSPLEATRALATALETPTPAPPGGRPAAAPPARAPTPQPALVTGTAPPLIGRADAIARVRASRVPLVLLSGEPGVGKTTVAEAAAQERWKRSGADDRADEGGAARSPRSVPGRPPRWWLRGQADDHGRPFAALADLLDAAWTTPVGRARLQRLDRPARLALTRLVPKLSPVPPAPPAPLSASSGDARDRRHFLLAAAVAALSALTAGDALLVDDLHAVDPDSLEVLDRWVRRSPAPAFGPLAIATARLEALADAPEASALVAALTTEGRCVTVTLEPWGETDVLALVRALSGREGGALFARRLHAATGGNPLFVFETLRHLIDIGELWAEPGGGWSTPYDDATVDYTELPVPAGVRQAAAARIARLDGATRRLLEAAALAVAPFTLEQLTPATALAPWQALDGLERAVGAGLLEPNGDGYRFSHELLRRAVEDGLRPERRTLIERRLAWSLERQRGAPSLIALHHERAGRRGDAFRWHRHAATEAARLYSIDVALEHLDRAEALATTDGDRVDIALQRVDLCDQAVDDHGSDAALQAARLAAERAGDPRSLARVALAEADAMLRKARNEEAIAAAASALSLTDDADLVADALLTQGLAHFAAGALEAADAAFAEALAALPPGPSLVRGNVHLSGFLHTAFARGDLAEAFRQVDLAEAALAPIGAHEAIAKARAHRGVLQMHQGDTAAATLQLEDSLEAARLSGDIAGQRRALLNLVKLHTDVADADAAEPLVAEGLALASGFEHPVTRVAFLQADAYVRYLRGDAGDALRALERSIEWVDASDYAIWRAQARTLALDLHLHLDHVARARDLWEETRTLIEDHDLGQLRPTLRVRAAALALAEGRPDAAVDDLRDLLADDDVLPQERGEAGLALARSLAHAGRPAEVLDALAPCRAAPTFEVALGALALELTALAALGRPAPEQVADARARIASGRLIPFEGVALRRGLAAQLDVIGDADGAAAVRHEADELEARLRASAATGTPAVRR